MIWNPQILELFKNAIISDVIPTFAYGFLKKIEQKNRIIDDKLMGQIKQNSIVLLYRLLFILYLEHQGTQKIKNRSYYKLSIDCSGPPIPAYPGTLFNSNAYPFFKQYNMDEKYFLQAIRCLKGEFLKELVNLDYSGFPIRYFGRIYEEILNFKLKITKEPINNRTLYLYQEKSDRKTTGSFYTPEYIIDYIVRNTIGPLIDEKIHDLTTISNRKCNDILNSILSFKVLDPSMGTGFFLLGAVDYIFKRVLEVFEKFSIDCNISHQLLRWEILKKIIYGIDLDPLALELAKMTLWLYVYTPKTRNNSEFSILNNHLKCGNTLFTNNINQMFGEKISRFDTVIGNPPYGVIFKENEKKLLKNLFQTTSKDSAAYFLEKSIKLSKNFIGMIIPKSIAFYSGWSSIREYIVQKTDIIRIGDVGIAFKDANFEELILILSIKNKKLIFKKTEIDVFSPQKRPIREKKYGEHGIVPSGIFSETKTIVFRPINNEEEIVLKKIRKNSFFLKDLDRLVTRGLYIPDSIKNIVLGKPLFSFPELKPKDSIIFINKVPDVSRYLIKKYYLISLSSLNSNKFLQRIEKISIPKVFIKVLRGKRLVAFPDPSGDIIPTEKLVCLHFTDKKTPYSYYFTSALLNSKIPSWYLQKTLFSSTTETSRVMDDAYLRKIPIPKININDNKTIKMIEKIDFLVKKIIEIKSKEEISEDFIKMEEKIEDVIFNLYGLDGKDRKIICNYFLEKNI